MIKLSYCKVCNADAYYFVDLFIGIDRYSGFDGEFQVQKCKCCGVVFLNPQPSFEEVSKYYPDNYYSYHFAENNSVIEKVMVKIKRLFYKRGFPVKKGTRILDVGCGNGEKISKFLIEGADCYGVEINEKPVEIARRKGVKAFYGDLLEHDFRDEFFDVIIMDNVFEHMANPDIILERIHNLLKKSGRLVIVVPNHNSLTRLLYAKYWIGYQVPQHMYTYSLHSLEKITSSKKFLIEKVRYTQNSYQFIASLRILLRSFSRSFELPSKPSKFFDNRVLTILLSFLLFPLNLLKVGDTIKIFLVKDEEFN